ncbi:hypothetical protein JRO89_XS08G0108900 [Xanthoceras sorbifolium]|uniref:DNA mismatch repair protein MLH3 n=1 Tax=Xanthoceras sorbifolium TaxID=99658 RepID=A0ABQ8HP89_9ROSI|nr:hypothetical protein JRO89_XS08G0108900 [Xanthoceras sorbifolium]
MPPVSKLDTRRTLGEFGNGLMGAIKRLPEALRNTVRSGVVLFDLTRVVEELVFNSLDAGARKVSVFFSVGTCYVKVVDDGSGISRDGLVLLGERYATSKLQHLADMDTASGTFGFRGEALASISDVSLLEVITKAYGRPTGYRKVMKGSKCLFLGIDDDTKDVGTTVVVRDLFYNQPVRRKCMQSRIALVHSKISFKVVDIESEVELLSTHSSSSPLSLLMSGFGIEDSSFLHELNADDDVFKISGYISSPCNTFSDKAFQYVYINSRYICKGPIHKLMNHLAACFESLDSWKVNSGSRKGKRKNRSQAYPAYILNLSCPQSLYGLTFEPSKTYVVFKDWEPVLTFFEKAIQTVWMKNKTYGESFNHTADMVGKDEILKKGDDILSAGDVSEQAEFSRFRFRNHQASLHLPSSFSEEHTRKDDNLFLGECERNAFQEFDKDTKKLKEENTEMEFYCQTDGSFPLLNDSIAECSSRVPWKIDNHLWTFDSNLSSKDSYFSKNRFSDAGRSICVESDFSSSQLGKEYIEIGPGIRSEPSGSGLFDADEFSNELELRKDIKQPFLQSCSSRGSLQFDGTLFSGEEGFESPTDSFKTKQKRTYLDERVNILEVDVNNQSFHFFPRTQWQDKVSYTHHSPRFMTKGDRSTGFDLPSRASSKSFSSYAEPFTEKTNFLSDSDALVGSDSQSLNSGWCPVTLDPLFRDAYTGVGHYTNENALEGSFRFGEEPNFGQLADGEENSKCSYDIVLKSTSQNNCISSCSDTGLDFEKHNDFGKDFYKIHLEGNLSKKVAPKHFDTLIDETDWLCCVSCGNNNVGISKFGSQRDPFRFQNCEKLHIPKESLRRSHSAPPFRRQKTRLISLNHCSAIPGRKPNVRTFQNALTSPEAGALKHLQQTSDVRPLHFKPSPVEDLLFGTRLDTGKSNTTVDMKKTQKGETFKQSAQAHHGAQGQDFISKEIQDSVESLTKWRNCCPQTTKNSRSCDNHYQDNILDISSGLLHFAGDLLIPESINKSCLEEAKVLHQVDKKYIAVVAGGTLAVIDQHAADERIRLEELRKKVLSGEAKTITYMDAEQELVLPEIGYQLLHSYAEQIKDWGWICNFHNQSSTSFKKNLSLLNRQPALVSLLAVPCILGVSLSDVDLFEFLQQLADTDGSSTMPPSVLRVLNSKACRGAIMFGDSLLPSECSLIVEELKQTSLCFQCAHGRPTTVPLVNLKALHKQIAQLGVLNNHTSEVWHGFRRHEPSLERARARLSAAKG